MKEGITYMFYYKYRGSIADFNITIIQSLNHDSLMQMQNYKNEYLDIIIDTIIIAIIATIINISQERFSGEL